MLIASDCIYTAMAAMDPNNGLFVVGYSLHCNVPACRALNFFEVARRDYGLIITNEYTKEYTDGQWGIVSDDGDRGAVYVKILTRGVNVGCGAWIPHRR